MKKHKSYHALKQLTAAGIATAVMATAPAAAPQTANRESVQIPQPGRDWTPEQQAIYTAINQDVAKAGLPLPTKQDPFPQAEKNEGFAAHENTGDIVVGVSRSGKHNKSIVDPVSTKWFSQSCNSPFADTALYERERTAVYAHEMAHHVDSKLNLSEPIKQFVTTGIKNPEDREILRTNVGERLADMTSTLYGLAHMKDSQDLMQRTHDWREARAAVDPWHDTGSSIRAAMDSYAKNPRPDISFTDAAKWSAQILDQQKGDLRKEYAVEKGVRTSMQNPDTLLLGHPTALSLGIQTMSDGMIDRVQQRYQEINAGRDKLCHPETTVANTTSTGPQSAKPKLKGFSPT